MDPIQTNGKLVLEDKVEAHKQVDPDTEVETNAESHIEATVNSEAEHLSAPTADVQVEDNARIGAAEAEEKEETHERAESEENPEIEQNAETKQSSQAEENAGIQFNSESGENAETEQSPGSDQKGEEHNAPSRSVEDRANAEHEVRGEAAEGAAEDPCENAVVEESATQKCKTSEQPVTESEDATIVSNETDEANSEAAGKSEVAEPMIQNEAMGSDALTTAQENEAQCNDAPPVETGQQDVEAAAPCIEHTQCIEQTECAQQTQCAAPEEQCAPESSATEEIGGYTEPEVASMHASSGTPQEQMTAAATEAEQAAVRVLMREAESEVLVEPAETTVHTTSSSQQMETVAAVESEQTEPGSSDLTSSGDLQVQPSEELEGPVENHGFESGLTPGAPLFARSSRENSVESMSIDETYTLAPPHPSSAGETLEENHEDTLAVPEESASASAMTDEVSVVDASVAAASVVLIAEEVVGSEKNREVSAPAEAPVGAALVAPDEAPVRPTEEPLAEDTAGETAEDTAGETAEDTAGETAEDALGETAEDALGETAEDTAGETAEEERTLVEGPITETMTSSMLTKSEAVADLETDAAAFPIDEKEADEGDLEQTDRETAGQQEETSGEQQETSGEQQETSGEQQERAGKEIEGDVEVHVSPADVDVHSTPRTSQEESGRQYVFEVAPRREKVADASSRTPPPAMSCGKVTHESQKCETFADASATKSLPRATPERHTFESRVKPSGADTTAYKPVEHAAGPSVFESKVRPSVASVRACDPVPAVKTGTSVFQNVAKPTFASASSRTALEPTKTENTVVCNTPSKSVANVRCGDDLPVNHERTLYASVPKPRTASTKATEPIVRENAQDSEAASHHIGSHHMGSHHISSHHIGSHHMVSKASHSVPGEITEADMLETNTGDEN